MRFLKPFFNLIVFTIFFFIRKVILADNSPITLLHIANKMIIYLKKHQTELKKKLQLPNRIQYQELVLTIGLDRMVGIVVDRLYWQQSMSPMLGVNALFVNLKSCRLAKTTPIITFHDGDHVQPYPKRENWNATMQSATNNSVLFTAIVNEFQ